MIREGILGSPRVNKLSDAEEVFYRRLLSVADDFGLFEASPASLRVRLYSGREEMPDEATVAAYMSALRRAGLIATFRWENHNVGYVARFRQRVRSKPLFGIPEGVITQAEISLFASNSYDGHSDGQHDGHNDGHNDGQHDRHVITPATEVIDSSKKDMTVNMTVMSVHPAPLIPSPISPPIYTPPFTPAPEPPPARSHACASEPRRGSARPSSAEEVAIYLRSQPTLRIIPKEIPTCATTFFDTMEAAGWVDTKGRNVWDWKAAARLFASRWQNNLPTKEAKKNYYET